MSTSDGSTTEYTGKDVSYYLVRIAIPKRLEPYDAECEDIIEALGMTFAEGCAFKAIWRKCAARTLGIAKAGYKGGLYDAEKAEYYGARMVAAELRAATVKESLTVHPAHPATFDHIDQAGVEPASAIEDDSERMQAIGQNGNGGEHYDHGHPSFEFAPDWANWIGQDADGTWYWFSARPQPFGNGWATDRKHVEITSVRMPNKYWFSTLAARPIK